MLKWINKWVVWRGIASLVWLCLPIGIAFAIWPESVQPKLLWLAVVPIIAAFLICVLNGVMESLRYLATVFTFPVIAICWLAFKCYRSANKAKKIYAYGTDPVIVVFYILFLFFNSIFIAFCRSSTTVDIMSVFAIVGNFLIICIAVRWAISPTRILNVPIFAMEHIQKATSATAAADAVAKKKNITLAELKDYESYRKSGDQWLTYIHARVYTLIAGMFIVNFLFLIMMTVINYACIFYANKQINSLFLQGMGNSFTDALLYSFSVITTAPIGNVQLVSQYEQLLYCAEIASAVLLITMFISMFSVGVGMQQESIVKFKDALESFRAMANRTIAEYVKFGLAKVKSEVASRSAETQNVNPPSPNGDPQAVNPPSPNGDPQAVNPPSSNGDPQAVNPPSSNGDPQAGEK